MEAVVCTNLNGAGSEPYVPRARNEAIAHLMQAGKILFGKLESKEWVDAWLKAEVHIQMRNF